MTYPVHPAAMLFPMMSEEELSGLIADIRENGLLEPILLYHGQILDGRNRFAACEKVGVEPSFTNANGSVSSPTSFVLSKNLHRRHLTISQRGAIAAEAAPLFREEAHARQIGSLKQNQHDSPSARIQEDGESKRGISGAIGKVLQISHDAVEGAIAIQKASPELFEKLKTGDITINAARAALRGSPRIRTKPDEPKKLNPQVAKAHKERMVSAMSTIISLCRGLGEELNVDQALLVCTDEEKKSWANRARESANKLRKFAVRLEAGTNAECQ